MTRPGVIRLNLHIWWANLCWRVYDTTHEKADDHDDTFAVMNAEKARWAGCRFINGHIYRWTSRGRIHAEVCACFLESAAAA